MSPLNAIRSIGRPVAFFPALAKYVGGVNAAILLGQLMYWDERTQENGLGVYKTTQEWEDETGLSYREQRTARAKLKERGLLIETYQRLNHRMFYKLDRAAFNTLIEQMMADKNSDDGENNGSENAQNKSKNHAEKDSNAAQKSSEKEQKTSKNLPENEGEIREVTKAQMATCAKRISRTDKSASRELTNAQLGSEQKRNSGANKRVSRYIDIDYKHRLHTENTSSSNEILDCPVEEIVSLYHKYLPENPPVRILDNARKEKIRARWKQAAALKIYPFFEYQNKEQGLAAWAEFFDICSDSDFLVGKVAPKAGNDRPFIADLDFLVSERGFKNCIENKYHRG